MATLRNKFHELGNWHNKISLVTIVTRDALEGINVDTISKEELSAIIKKASIDLSKYEDYVVGADKVVREIKPFVYAELGLDAEIFDKSQTGHCWLTRGFRSMVVGCAQPVHKMLKKFGTH